MECLSAEEHLIHGFCHQRWVLLPLRLDGARTQPNHEGRSPVHFMLTLL